MVETSAKRSKEKASKQTVKAPKKSKIDDMNMNIEEYEMSMPEIKSKMEADAAILKCGSSPLEKSAGEVMCFAAMYGLVNVLKFYESPSHPLSYVNQFGEGLLHYAAKGNQSKLTAYLLLRGLDPNVENRFLETPIFIAAEMGSIEVLNMLASDARCKAEHQDKFGDTIMHVAARDGQTEILNYLLTKYGKKMLRIKN